MLIILQIIHDHMKQQSNLDSKWMGFEKRWHASNQILVTN